jgi:hypothetical protein
MVFHRPSGIDIPGLLWCASYCPSHSWWRDSVLWLRALLTFFSVLSIITLVEYAIPGTSMFSGESIRLTVPWVSLSVGLNIVVTSMICFRVLRMRTIVREVLSPEMSRMYTSIVAILIESAAPFSILGIGLIVTAALELPLFLAFTYVWTMFCVESHSHAYFSVRKRQILLNASPSFH